MSKNERRCSPLEPRNANGRRVFGTVLADVAFCAIRMCRAPLTEGARCRLARGFSGLVLEGARRAKRAARVLVRLSFVAAVLVRRTGLATLA